MSHVELLTRRSVGSFGQISLNQKKHMLNLNYWNLTYREHTINLQPGKAVQVLPGDGYIVDDALFPQEAPRGPFRPSRPGTASLVPSTEVPKRNDLLSSQMAVFQSTTVEEEATNLSIAFSARFGIASAKAAYERARLETSSKIIFYLRAESTSPGDQIASEQIRWNTPPEAEDISDPDQRMRQFLDDYGSHYAVQVFYGQSLYIRVACNSHMQQAHEKISAAINAVGLFWRVGGEFSREAREFFSSQDCSIETSLLGGAVNPSGALYVTGIDQVLDLVDKLRKGQVTIDSGPLQCRVWSYWHTLKAFPKCRELFDRYTQPTPVPTPFGVPKGTVLMWAPDEGNLRRDSASGEIVEVIPPEGWVNLDGSKGGKDLTDRVPMAVGKWSRLWEQGGRKDIPDDGAHTPSGSLPWGKGARDGYGFQGEGDECMLLNISFNGNPIPGHNHGGENRPPYFGLFFIMKL